MRGTWHFRFFPEKSRLGVLWAVRSLREEQYHLLGGRLSQLHGEVEDVRSVGLVCWNNLWLFSVYRFHSSLWSLTDSLKSMTYGAEFETLVQATSS